MVFSGIVLAGGLSRRMGTNKLSIKMGNIPLLSNQILKLSFFCDEVIVSTSSHNYDIVNYECSRIKRCNDIFNNKGRAKTPEIKIVLDDFEGLDARCNPGPIIGIYSGLKNISNTYSFVTAFDMPFISTRLLGLLKDLCLQDFKDPKDVYMIRTEKGYEVMCGIYSRKCIDILHENILNGNNKISNIFKSVQSKVISESFLKDSGIDMKNFFNINTKSDYKAFKEILWPVESYIAGKDKKEEAPAYPVPL